MARDGKSGKLASVKRRGHPRRQGARTAWLNVLGVRPTATDPNELDFERTEALIGALLDHEWPAIAALREGASHGEVIVHYLANMASGDKDLLLRGYLLLEVMLDEVDGPGVADAVNTFLPPLPIEPGV